MIRSGFGAPKDRFVLSGSEGEAAPSFIHVMLMHYLDNHVYVWKANSPQPVQVLAGHEDTVNCVAWNPVASRRLFASCSDDTTIRIWQPPEASDELMSSTAMGSGIADSGTNGNGLGRTEVKVEGDSEDNGFVWRRSRDDVIARGVRCGLYNETAFISSSQHGINAFPFRSR